MPSSSARSTTPSTPFRKIQVRFGNTEAAPFARLVMAGWAVVFAMRHWGGWRESGTTFHLPVGCPFRWVTGIECPGCGMTRAFTHIADLDFSAAVHANPWSIPLFLYFAADALALIPTASDTGQRRDRRPWGPLLAAVLVWWACCRLAPALLQ